MSGEPDPEDPVPLFGSWRAIYAAVIVSAMVVMALVWIFTAVPY